MICSFAFLEIAYHRLAKRVRDIELKREREGWRGRDIQTLLRYAALSNQFNDYQITTTTSRVPLGESMDTPFDVLDRILNFWIVVQRGPRIEPASTASAD